MDAASLQKFDEDFVKTDIFQAIIKNNAKELLRFIRRGDNIHLNCKHSKMTYLHVIMKTALPVTETKFVPMVYQLSNASIDLNLTDKSGLSPLQLAIKGSLLELMAAVLKCGAVADPEKDDAFFHGPCMYELQSWYRKFGMGFWDAVENDKAFKVNVLVKSWFRINITRNNKSLIEFAKETNSCDKIINMLINNEVTMDFVHVTIAGDEDKMRYLLLHHPVDVHTRNMSHRSGYFDAYSPLTLYGAAEMYEHEHLLPLLSSLEKEPRYSLHKKQADSSKHTESVICVIS